MSTESQGEPNCAHSEIPRELQVLVERMQAVDERVEKLVMDAYQRHERSLAEQIQAALAGLAATLEDSLKDVDLKHEQSIIEQFTATSPMQSVSSTPRPSSISPRLRRHATNYVWLESRIPTVGNLTGSKNPFQRSRSSWNWRLGSSSAFTMLFRTSMASSRRPPLTS